VRLSVCEHYSPEQTYDWIRVHVLTAFVPQPARDSREPMELATADYCLDCEIAYS
jgi:hypothetical protein